MAVLPSFSHVLKQDIRFISFLMRAWCIIWNPMMVVLLWGQRAYTRMVRLQYNRIPDIVGLLLWLFSCAAVFISPWSKLDVTSCVWKKRNDGDKRFAKQAGACGKSEAGEGTHWLYGTGAAAVRVIRAFITEQGVIPATPNCMIKGSM